MKDKLTGFPGSPGLPENPISPGRPFAKKVNIECIMTNTTHVVTLYQSDSGFWTLTGGPGCPCLPAGPGGPTGP